MRMMYNKKQAKGKGGKRHHEEEERRMIERGRS